MEYSNSKANGNGSNQDKFQTGDFIVNRQDIFLDWPAIWRVDSTTLLQKFEPFHSNGKTIYRSLSTYAQWTPESRRSYILAKCIQVGQVQHEMHVELQRSELCSATSEIYIEKVMQEAFTSLQDQFEVYIQTLISQALDSNFLTEIMQEQDEYFLSNVKTIDDLTTGRKTRLRNTMPWPNRLLNSIEIWPCYNIIHDLGITNNGQIICVACNKRNIVSRVILYGQPYNPNTIRPTQIDGRFSYDKDFLLCRSCVMHCELLHKISHQKYLMFMQCSKKVAEKNADDPTKGTTVILNELLADETWLSQLFKTVRRVWAEVDQIERQRFLS